MHVEALDEGLFRLLVPFEDLHTTVYVVKSGEGAAIIDTATYPSDVDTYILPALDALGIDRAEVRYLLLTHAHGDHAGGLERLRTWLPDATVGASFSIDALRFLPLAEGTCLLGRIRVVELAGHTKNSVGFFDTSTRTLLSGDCLQLGGVGKYRDGISYPSLYRASVERLRGMEIERIVAAHEYDPLGSVAEGKAAVAVYLDTCLSFLKND